MNKDVTYLSEIISALRHYGGMASLKEINTYIENHNTLPNIQTNPKWTNNVSAVIQRNCSQTKSYRGGADIFFLYTVWEKAFGGCGKWLRTLSIVLESRLSLSDK